MKKLRLPRIFRNRIFVFTVTVLLVICATVIIVSYSVFSNYFEKSLIRSTESSLRLVSDNIDSHLANVYRLVRFCRGNPSVADYIDSNPEPGSVKSVATYDRIAEEYGNNSSSSYIPRMAVVTDKHFLQIVNATYSSTVDLSKDLPRCDFFAKLIEADDYDFSTGFIKDPFYKNGVRVLPIVRPITYRFNSRTGGFLFMEVTPELFTDAFSRYSLEEDSHVYLNLPGHSYLFDGRVLTEVEAFTVKDARKNAALMDDTIVEKVTDFRGINTIMVSIPLDMPDCTISCSVSLTQLHTKQLFMWITILSVALAITAFGFLLMRRRLRQEKEKNDLEYKMLQSQINPHFIYNTLNSIKWMATVQGSEGIAEMTTALAKLLKSLSKGSSLNVPIREELSLLKDYCTIQSYRYGGTITVDIRTDDPSIEDCSIVKFTLQPLVENAIFHGIEPKGAGHIDVHLYREEGTIRIDVSDDGVGMSEEKAAAILTNAGEARSDFFRELGVYNVNRRLLFEYGEPAGITIDSTEGKGTKMTVRIPAKQ
ncbi:MAG: sensor histidine kinase [Lachnospiraceae bacterium]|nr:sensor histidine kinase [Lachnospiraceae bacterium]